MNCRERATWAFRHMLDESLLFQTEMFLIAKCNRDPV